MTSASRKVVIVTGASGTLCGVMAAKFVARGDRVVVHYNSAKGRAEKLSEQLNAGPGEAFAFKADVSRYEEVEEMVQETIRRWERVDVLVNGAGGVFGAPGQQALGYPTVATPEEVWRRTLEVNLTGSFHCIKAVGPHMMKQRGGHIINISSGAGLAGAKNSAPYAVAKAGVIALAKTAARELGRYNVRVNTICPGLMPTDLPGSGDEILRHYVERVAILHRHGTPEELANFVVHVSDMENISGQLFNTDSRILF